MFNYQIKKAKTPGKGSLIIISVCAILFLMAIISNSINIVKNISNNKPLVPITTPVISEIGYYTDENDWINNEQVLMSGMLQFQKMTGVHPYVYICNNFSYKSEKESDLLYANLFKEKNLPVDQSYMLLIFMEANGEYAINITSGENSKPIVNDKTISMIKDYAAKYYNSSLSDSEYFSQIFSSSAEDMINKNSFKSLFTNIAIMTGGSVIICVLWTTEIKKYKKKRNEQHECLNEPNKPFSYQAKADAKNLIDRINKLIK